MSTPSNDFKDRLVAQVQQFNKEVSNVMNPPLFYSRAYVENLQVHPFVSITELVSKLDQACHCLISPAMFGSLLSDPLFLRYFDPVPGHSLVLRGLLGFLQVNTELKIPLLTDAYARPAQDERIFDPLLDRGFYILVPADQVRPLE